MKWKNINYLYYQPLIAITKTYVKALSFTVLYRESNNKIYKLPYTPNIKQLNEPLDSFN